MAAGDFDQAFGTRGVRTLALPGFAWAGGVAVDGSGRIVVGVTWQQRRDTMSELRVARLRPDGGSDTAFAGGVARYVDPQGGWAEVCGVAVQPDGRVLAAVTVTRTGAAEYGVVRLGVDGRIDTGFGTRGYAAVRADGAWYVGAAMALQPDGRIVVAGHYQGPEDSTRMFAVSRFNVDGSLDTTFDGSGTIVVRLGGDDWGRALALQPDGGIVVAGSTQPPGEAARDFAVLRLRADGSPDSGFGHLGAATLGLGGDDVPAGVAIDPAGRIVVAGSSQPAGGDEAAVAVVRFSATGVFDRTLGVGGLVIHPVEGDFTTTTLLLTGHRVLCVGSHLAPEAEDRDFGLVRFDPGGTADASFGTAGRAFRGLGGYDWATAAAAQPDGKIILAGWSIPKRDGKVLPNADRTVAVARFLG